MAKVIVTIAPEDGMCFENILSFKTENYIGIWDNVSEGFVLMRKSAIYFEPYFIGGYRLEDLKDLDDFVYEKCDEHITEVFDKSDYTIELN